MMLDDIVKIITMSIAVLFAVVGLYFSITVYQGLDEKRLREQCLEQYHVECVRVIQYQPK